MSAEKDYAVQFTAKEKACLVTSERDGSPLGEMEVDCRTVVSLISAGTEINGSYRCSYAQDGVPPPGFYPRSPGYAAVLEVEAAGAGVTSVNRGDLVFAVARHRLFQRLDESSVLRVPDGLEPEKAVFARMVKIPMPTFVHTHVRPPEKCVITGLGVVGLMAAQVAGLYGYQVTACEPDPVRRKIGEEHDLENVLDSVPLDDPECKGTVGLGLDCSGHELAVLDLCKTVRSRGEVYLVGVPWKPFTDLCAQKILHAVFHNYAGLHSGWEGVRGMNLPAPDIHSALHHFAVALNWLASGMIKIGESVYSKVSPEDPQAVYQDILHRRFDALSAVFDWREL